MIPPKKPLKILLAASRGFSFEGTFDDLDGALDASAFCPRRAENRADRGRPAPPSPGRRHPPAGAVLLMEDVAQVEALDVSDPDNLAYATQTTLSVDDTIGIVGGLRRRFPAIHGPNKEDICHATTNRQAAVKEIAPKCDGLAVIGAPNSSNPMQLVAACRERYDATVEEVWTTEESVVFKSPRLLVA